MFLLLLDKYPKLELLGHREAVWLTLYETTKQISKVVLPFDSPTDVNGSSRCPASLQTVATISLILVHVCHSAGCTGVSCCGFSLYFLDESSNVHFHVLIAI